MSFLSEMIYSALLVRDGIPTSCAQIEAISRRCNRAVSVHGIEISSFSDKLSFFS
jgi:hypothetical protein